MTKNATKQRSIRFQPRFVASSPVPWTTRKPSDVARRCGRGSTGGSKGRIPAPVEAV